MLLNTGFFDVLRNNDNFQSRKFKLLCDGPLKMKDILHCFEHNKFLLVIEGFDYLKDSSGTSKVVKSHELLFREHGFDCVCIYPLLLAYRVGITLTEIYGISVNGKPCGFTGLNNLRFAIGTCERAHHALAGILIHHAIYNRLDVLGEFLQQFQDTKKVFYLHDYWTCCLSINMLRDRTKNTWCHSDLREGCQGCAWHKANMMHRQAIKEFFSKIGECTFIAPSESVARGWVKWNPSGFTHADVIGHLNATSVSSRKEVASDGPIRVAFVGAPAVNKGWLEFQSIVQHCHRNIRLYHMGHTDLRLPGVQNVDVQIHKQGLDAMIRALREHRIDVSLLLSGWLETYSYTLFESLQAQSLVCCLDDSGNVADVVHETGLGWCFKDLETLQAFLNAEDLVSCVREKQRKARFPQAMVTNDAIVSYFSEAPISLGDAVLSVRYSFAEDIKATLTAAGIGAFNCLKAIVKGVFGIGRH